LLAYRRRHWQADGLAQSELGIFNQQQGAGEAWSVGQLQWQDPVMVKFDLPVQWRPGASCLTK
jgi:hypothetical protein